MMQVPPYSQYKLFTIGKPLRALMNFALFGAFFALFVFGSYGTTDGGLESTGQHYLIIAFPAATALLTGLLFWAGLKRGSVTVSALHTHEGFLLVCFYALSLIALLSAPQKLPGTLATIVATFVTLLFVTNYATTKQRFIGSFRFFCSFIYVTALIALLLGVYTFWVGSFTLGPLLVEFNPMFRRVNSWFLTSTAFGVFLAYGVVTTIYFVRTSLSWAVRSIHLMVLSGFVIGMGLSGARTPFVVLIAAFLALAVTRLSFRKRYIAVLGLSVPLLMFALRLTSSYSEEIFILRRFQGGDTGTMGGRSEMWQKALLESWDQLGSFQTLFGSGLGTFKEVLGWDIGAHSGMLRILIEHGILGLTTFLALMSLTLWQLMLIVRHTPRPTPEMTTLLLFFALFFSAETVVQQLMGISMDYLLFLTLLGFQLSARGLYLYGKSRVSLNSQSVIP